MSGSAIPSVSLRAVIAGEGFDIYDALDIEREICRRELIKTLFTILEDHDVQLFRLKASFCLSLEAERDRAPRGLQSTAIDCRDGVLDKDKPHARFYETGRAYFARAFSSAFLEDPPSQYAESAPEARLRKYGGRQAVVAYHLVGSPTRRGDAEREATRFAHYGGTLFLTAYELAVLSSRELRSRLEALPDTHREILLAWISDYPLPAHISNIVRAVHANKTRRQTKTDAGRVSGKRHREPGATAEEEASACAHPTSERDTSQRLRSTNIDQIGGLGHDEHAAALTQAYGPRVAQDALDLAAHLRDEPESDNILAILQGAWKVAPSIPGAGAMYPLSTGGTEFGL